MTICKFYASGYCRFGESCRFQHINPSSNYYQKNYSRNDGQQTQSSGASNKSGFSFIRALDTISHTNRAPAQSPSFFGGSSTSRSNEPPMSSSNRAFQVPRSVSSQTKLVPNSGFSFNRTLNQISSTGLQPNMLTVNDIDMDSSVFNRMQPSMTSQELKPNPFGFASSAGLSNNSGLFGNKRVITSPTTQTMATADPNFSQSSSVPKDNDIYSNASDLSDNDVNCFKSMVSDGQGPDHKGYLSIPFPLPTTGYGSPEMPNGLGSKSFACRAPEEKGQHVVHSKLGRWKSSSSNRLFGCC